MVRRLSLFVLLASACVFLASLYLLWTESTSTAAGTGPKGLLNLFGGASFYGWAGSTDRLQRSRRSRWFSEPAFRSCALS